jgi:hypothetical protein
MSNRVSSVASLVRESFLSRLAIACACASIIEIAAAQTISSTGRAIYYNTAILINSEPGPWDVSLGPNVWQISDVSPTHVEAKGKALVYGGNVQVDSSCGVAFVITTPRVFVFSGTVVGFDTLNGLPSDVGSCSASISQGSTVLSEAKSAQSAPFDAVVPFSFSGVLPPGEYYVQVGGSASGTWTGYDKGGYAEFDVTFDWLPVCDTATGSCFAAHDTPGCSSHGCCSFVCDADPFCCETIWDGVCVSEADAACTPAYVTGPIINPWNGHRHRLLDSTYWADSLPGVAGTEHGFITIHNALENQWVRDALLNNIPGWTPAPAFIGLSDLDQEGDFVWSSGQPFDFADWYPGEPNDQDGEDVVEMSHLHGLWNDISAGVTRAAITDSGRSMCGGLFAGDCYEEGSTKGCADEACCNAICDIDQFCCDAIWDSFCAMEASSYCEPSIVAGPFQNPSTGHRYYVLSPTSWSLAERRARELGGHLATIDSLTEATWIAWAVYVALGINNYAIGFDDQAVDGSFRWADGAAVSYTAWRSGQPSLGGVPGRATVGSDQLWSEAWIGAIGPAVIEAPCLCDTTHDGTVGGDDLAGLLGAWGTQNPTFDFTSDGVVDAADLSVMLGEWGSCFGGPACGIHSSPGSNQPGCDSCVCGLDPACCEITWDAMCVYLAKYQCPFACNCP